MKVRRLRNIKGMTLIEILLYLALFSIFFLVMVEFFLFVNQSNQLSSETLKLDRSVIFLTQHLEDSFEKKSFTSITDIEESDLDELELYDSAVPEYTYKVGDEDGELQFNDGSGNVQITRSDIIVDKFSLEEILDNEDTVIGAKITIRLKSKTDNTVQREFSNSYLNN